MKKLLLILLIFLGLGINASIDHFADALSKIVLGKKEKPKRPSRRPTRDQNGQEEIGSAFDIDPGTEKGKTEREKVIYRYEKESKKFDYWRKNLIAKRGLYDVVNLFKSIKALRSLSTQIISLRSGDDEKINKIFESKNLKTKKLAMFSIDAKNSLEEILRYILEIDPTHIQRIIQIRRDAIIDTKSYNFMIKVFRRVIDLMEYNIDQLSKRKKGLTSGEKGDIIRAFSFPFSIISNIEEAKFIKKNKKDKEAIKFIKNFDAQIKRLLFILKNNKVIIKEIGIDIDDLEKTFDPKEDKRIWCCARSGFVLIDNIDKTPPPGIDYYKKLYVELEEIVNSIKKLENPDLLQYLKIFNEQFIISRTNRFNSYYHKEGMCQICFKSDIRESGDYLKTIMIYLDDKKHSSNEYAVKAINALNNFYEIRYYQRYNIKNIKT